MSVKLTDDVSHENRHFPRIVRGIPVAYTTDPLQVARPVRAPVLVVVKEPYDLDTEFDEHVVDRAVWAYCVIARSPHVEGSANYTRINNLTSARPRWLLYWHVWRVLRHASRALRE